MNILIFNCGSSSLKYKMLALPEEKSLASGEAQRVGAPTAEKPYILHNTENGQKRFEVEMETHGVAFDSIMKLLREESNTQVDAFGHRIVHGGEWFTEPTLITEDVLEKLHRTERLAPIHNPPAIGLIEECCKRRPKIPQVAVFDTAFHKTIPPYAHTYALPDRLRNQEGIRKYGFHGTSHGYVVEEGARFLNCSLYDFNAVSCHLGSGGASLCAVKNGCSVDNTMGFSPLQGLMMSSRCGDLDPTLPLRYLTRADGHEQNVEHLLNKKSGVLGVSDYSADIRDIFSAISEHAGQDQNTKERFQLTAEMYLWRIRKYLAAYIAIVGKPRTIIFTDTIGETFPEAREAICRNMEFFGLQIDTDKNQNGKPPLDIASSDSPVRILVIETDEELNIARQTAALLNNDLQHEKTA